MSIDRVICVCSRKDADVWAVASRQLVQNVSAADYGVIVPGTDVGYFKSISDSKFLVQDERDYSSGVKEKIAQRLGAVASSGVGWYLQQFIKIGALAELGSGQTGLLWDADTVPLKRLQFVHGDQLVHYSGNENHGPYFTCMDRLLGISRQRGYSFIAQCLAVKGRWVADFIAALEERHGMAWVDSILGIIDFQQKSAFSEFETLGNFFISRYSGEMRQLPSNRWCRYGNGLIGNVRNIDTVLAKVVLRAYDFVSFERWDDSWSRYPRPLRPSLAKLFPAA